MYSEGCGDLGWVSSDADTICIHNTAVQVLCNTTHVIDHSPPLLRLYDFSDPKMGLTAQCGSAHVITILVTTLLFRLLVLIVH